MISDNSNQLKADKWDFLIFVFGTLLLIALLHLKAKNEIPWQWIFEGFAFKLGYMLPYLLACNILVGILYFLNRHDISSRKWVAVGAYLASIIFILY